MDDRSDGQLLAAWTGGDPRAFEGLVDRHQSALLRHARAFLGTGGGGEDVVQEAFLRLAQRPPELPAAASGDAHVERAVLASWLHKVTRNLCMDALRSEKRRRHREEAVAPEEAVRGGLDGVELADTREAVEKGLAKLPTDQREVLVLRLFSERSYKEIADITGKKVGTIGWLISVGLKTLAGELAPLLGPAQGPGNEGNRMQSPETQSLQGGLS
jgi:RNA polymerase sigma-70 factor (ECF subfamily)